MTCARQDRPSVEISSRNLMAEPLTSIELCAGAGGQARGLELAGFDHLALVENDPWACETLRRNRPEWNVFGPYLSDPRHRQGRGSGDVTRFDATAWRGKVDLLAGGPPCPPFSKAGRQLGAEDERDLFPAALDIIDDCQPRAVMLENVRGMMDAKFDSYREGVVSRLSDRYHVMWDVVHASRFGVPQLRPRAVLIAIEKKYASAFQWPNEDDEVEPLTVGQALLPYMREGGWVGAEAWAERADKIAPTLVGGSKKHGGADLGPTRAKRAWSALGVDAMGLADAPPTRDFVGMPKLTVKMAGVLQGFDPEQWVIYGRKTAAYRQVGNAFPPPVARVFGVRIREALRQEERPSLTISQGTASPADDLAAGRAAS